MKKQDFIGRLMNYGTGFALGFLTIIGMAVMFVLGLVVIVLAAFFDRVFN